MSVQATNSSVPAGADRPRLKIAIGGYGHTAAIKKGAIPIDGVDADFVEVDRKSVV